MVFFCIPIWNMNLQKKNCLTDFDYVKIIWSKSKVKDLRLALELLQTIDGQ